MCRCIDIDGRMTDGTGKPARFSDEQKWRLWYDRELTRLCSIGRDRLVKWYEQTKHQTHVATYGATQHELASCVAHALTQTEPITPAMREYENSDDPCLSWPWAVINATILRLA